MTLSLHQRLLIYLLTATALVWVLVGVVSVTRTRAEVEKLFDARLSQSARVLLSLVGHEMLEEAHGVSPASRDRVRFAELESHLSNQAYDSPVAFQVRVVDSALSFASANAPAQPFSARDEGLSDVVLDGVVWRVLSRHDDSGRIVVHFAEQRAAREELVNQVAWQFVWPLGAGLPVLGLIIWVGVGHGIRPLSALADAVGARDPAHLEQIDERSIPHEVRPLVISLNRLFARLDSALDGERRFTADAAHELRSPLAALKTHAEVAIRAPDAERRERALEQIVAGVDRAGHLVTQMLTLARLDPEAASTGFEPVELGAAVEEVMAELVPAAVRRSIDVSLDVRGSPVVHGNAAALRVMTRNIVQNAIGYSPDGGRVEVRVESRDGAVVTLSVADSGPGIPVDEREDVLQRFYRRGGNRVPGSGLGLSIVKRVADLHGAAIRLCDAELGGLEVSVRF